MRAAVAVVLSVCLGWFLIQLGDHVDWSAVGAALGHLTWWQALVLVGLLAARQIVNATPVSRFVDGLSRPRAVQNDLTANLTATITPPPADVVARIAMFRSWGVDPVDGMAAVTLTSFVFYSARLLAPLLGLALLAVSDASEGYWIVATISGTAALAILAALIIAARSQGWSMLVGRWAARVAVRMRRDVDEEAWVAAVVTFQEHAAERLRRHLVPAFGGLLAGILVEGALLVASLRFVGIDQATLGTLEILGGFLMAYPLTMLPMFGLGVMDALLLVGWSATAGEAYESALLAGTLVWRTVTIGGALVLGALATAWWRWSVAHKR